MPTLARRATPSQRKILKAVEGAVKNVRDSHPGKYDIPDRLVRSIAKRAAGTLTAQWPDVLAAREYFLSLSEKGKGLSVVRPSLSKSHPLKSSRKGSVAKVSRHSPLLKLHRDLTRQMRVLKENRDASYVEAMIDVLKMISKIVETTS